MKYKQKMLEHELIGGFAIIKNLSGGDVHQQLSIKAWNTFEINTKYAKIFDHSCFKLEYLINGVIWNDLPKNKINIDSNRCIKCAYSSLNSLPGAYLKDKFSKRQDFSNNLVWQSHFGNLQFLHAMKSSREESINTTKNLMKKFLENILITAKSISTTVKVLFDFDKIKEQISYATNKETAMINLRTPEETEFEEKTKKETDSINPNLHLLGIIFHMFQDSYAESHMKRDYDSVSGLKVGQPIKIFCYGKGITDDEKTADKYHKENDHHNKVFETWSSDDNPYKLNQMGEYIIRRMIFIMEKYFDFLLDNELRPEDVAEEIMSDNNLPTIEKNKFVILEQNQEEAFGGGAL